MLFYCVLREVLEAPGVHFEVMLAAQKRCQLWSAWGFEQNRRDQKR